MYERPQIETRQAVEGLLLSWQAWYGDKNGKSHS